MFRIPPLLLLLCFASSELALAADDHFREHVAPVFARRCLSCHSDSERKGDFSLQTSTAAFADGYIEPGDPAASHLLDVITPGDGAARMPKNADPLSAEELAAIRQWIAAGAKWPQDFELTEPRVADLDWWSLKPLKRPAVPAASAELVRTPIDAFIAAKLAEQKLTPAPEADRRSLIRRLYFDLVGLPPAPKDVEAFVNDSDPAAYEKLVDQLLASPGYGERWARHWLDVVHYADTHGYDKDKPRPHAWPYRDYVIRSLNEDKPYARFVQEQIAGDVLWPQTRDGITATGFIAAGPWDFIGHVEVPETKIDGRIARHLDRDDMVSSTMNTFCSTTVQCARCHNHKFDPITQEHYFSLQAVFAALDRADRPYDISPEIAQRRVELQTEQTALLVEEQKLDAAVQQAGGAELANIDRELAGLQKQQQPGERPEFGYHSQIVSQVDLEKWVQVDLGGPTAIESIVYVGCHDTFNGIGHGFGFPVRYKIELSNSADFDTSVVAVVDHTRADVANPGTEPQFMQLPPGTSARYVRFTATQLAERRNDYIFALAELSVLTPDGRNAALGRPVTSLDSIEAPVRWQRQNLVDGYYYGVSAAADATARIAKLNAARQELLKRLVGDKLQQQLAANKAAIAKNDAALKSLPAPGKVYAGTVHRGSGNFIGRGHVDGEPRPIHVLHRGDIQDPRKEVSPGTIPVIADVPWQFALPSDHAEADRRMALARWLTRPDNPLTWRSIVNRVWQYHFGRGIVDTPNDFGRMGKLPSHPELLDWLAVEFRDGGGSLKKLHRLIVTSRVYRQASAHDSHNAEIDSENIYLWRMNRRRLTAEEVRDSVLAVSGKLDRAMYGPGFQLFAIEQPEHSPHYEYDQHDPNDAKTHRRTIYRFIVRSQPDPFLTTLDCADSSQSVAKRDETVTALQALSLLNNKFMLAMAEHFAARLEAEAEGAARVDRAFELAIGHPPDEEQRRALAAYAQEFGLPNACRLIFNLNEFVFID